MQITGKIKHTIKKTNKQIKRAKNIWIQKTKLLKPRNKQKHNANADNKSLPMRKNSWT